MMEDNKWVAKILRDYNDCLPGNYQYFVIGSTALISYTSKIGYVRKIKDIDIICSDKNFTSIADKLKEKGYEQNTFVDRNTPFYGRLKRLAETKYFRFVKDNKGLEIMTSPFREIDKEIEIELYPGVRFSFPTDSISSTNLYEVSFKAVTPEALFCIYSLGHNTWGKIASKGKEKREEDIRQLRPIINEEKLEKVASNIFLHLRGIKLKIPTFLIYKE